eukprot:7516326-Ditylum_brightwellii.AAC.1
MAIVMETVVLVMRKLPSSSPKGLNTKLLLALVAMGSADDFFNCNGNCVGDNGAGDEKTFLSLHKRSEHKAAGCFDYNG